MNIKIGDYVFNDFYDPDSDDHKADNPDFLGEGTQAMVFRARHYKTGQIVAVKISRED